MRAHPRRSAARRTSLSSGKGASIKMLPGWYGGPARWPSANTARRTRRLAGIRRMWPSHWCLRVRTAVRRSYEGVVASLLASHNYNTYQQPVGVGLHYQLPIWVDTSRLPASHNYNTPTAGRRGATLSATYLGGHLTFTSITQLQHTNSR